MWGRVVLGRVVFRASCPVSVHFHILHVLKGFRILKFVIVRTTELNKFLEAMAPANQYDIVWRPTQKFGHLTSAISSSQAKRKVGIINVNSCLCLLYFSTISIK